MRSAIYEGMVVHHRREPVVHRFAYRVALPLIDLDEIDQVCSGHRLWSAERPNVVWFRRPDFLGGGRTPIDTAVRDEVEAHLGLRPSGPIALLAHLRTWGWLFNPIALYYCFDPTGAHVEALVADVTNTPWHEHRTYVVGAPGQHRVDKALHVSPFFGMDHTYGIDYTPPGDRLTVHLGNETGGRRVFDATLRLRRHPIDHRQLGRVISAYPLMTMQVSAAIYRQALALWRTGVPIVPHPGRGGDPRGGRTGPSPVVPSPHRVDVETPHETPADSAAPR